MMRIFAAEVCGNCLGEPKVCWHHPRKRSATLLTIPLFLSTNLYPGAMEGVDYKFVQSHFSDGQIIIQIVLNEFVYQGSRVYPKGWDSRVYLNGRGSR
jgi:hypothetical protein